MNLQEITPDKVVDARSMACPGPLLEAKKAVGTVEVGQVLEVQSADIASKEDIPAWCRKTGHEYLGVAERDGYNSFYVIRRK